ncbi:MAG: lytic transglycosylase domain-containing protein [Deltaproteobacteria bacterium]|nr:lytic transglycosylase domain-containing protein [Deltaproteobacteria bacterium]
MLRIFYQVLFLVFLISPNLARAELYSFIDEQGVVHFTNIPNDSRYKPLPTTSARNTYTWGDDLGKMRKIHRVDVNDYDAIIVAAARYYTLPAALIKAIIAVESAFEVQAVSNKGAQGLMQLMPDTAAAMYVNDPFNARDNIYGGTRYIRLLANSFNGHLRHTIAAYNAGPKAVEREKDVPSIAETRLYVQRVLILYKHYATSWKP